MGARNIKVNARRREREREREREMERVQCSGGAESRDYTAAGSCCDIIRDTARPPSHTHACTLRLGYLDISKGGTLKQR